MHVNTNTDNFVTLKDVHRYNTRNINSVVIPHHNLELLKKPYTLSLSFYNFVPKRIKEINMWFNLIDIVSSNSSERNTSLVLYIPDPLL